MAGIFGDGPISVARKFGYRGEHINYSNDSSKKYKCLAGKCADETQTSW